MPRRKSGGNGRGGRRLPAPRASLPLAPSWAQGASRLPAGASVLVGTPSETTGVAVVHVPLPPTEADPSTVRVAGWSVRVVAPESHMLVVGASFRRTHVFLVEEDDRDDGLSVTLSGAPGVAACLQVTTTVLWFAL
jgi:hypothetical protein